MRVRLEEAGVDLEAVKRQLMTMARDLAARLRRSDAPGDEPGDSGPGPDAPGDEQREERFREDDAEWAVLQDVRDALGRLEDGTYGRCQMDGGPIEEERLRAIPWARYCVRHQTALEGRPSRRASL